MVKTKKELKKELKEKALDILNEKFILFLINKYGGGIREFSKEVKVSEKMIYLYINNYYIPKSYPKFLRKKEGGYPRFKNIINTYLDFFISDVIEKAEEKGMEVETLLEATIELIQE